MVTAVYARKSSEQSGVADEQKSVTRQIEHARQYAARKGYRAAPFDPRHRHIIPMGTPAFARPAQSGASRLF